MMCKWPGTGAASDDWVRTASACRGRTASNMPRSIHELYLKASLKCIYFILSSFPIKTNCILTLFTLREVKDAAPLQGEDLFLLPSKGEPGGQLLGACTSVSGQIAADSKSRLVKFWLWGGQREAGPGWRPRP